MKYQLASDIARLASEKFLQPGQPHDRLHGCNLLWVFQDCGLDESGFSVELISELWHWHTGMDVLIRIESDVWVMCTATDLTHHAVDYLLTHILVDGKGHYQIRTPQLQALLSAAAQSSQSF